MTIVGRAGVGKTAMICRLLNAIESGKLPDDLGEMKVDGIVYLSEAGSHRVNFANVFADLSKLLPKDIAASLESSYKDPKTSTGDKTRKLLDAFPQGRVVLLLDNFENLVDAENLAIKDGEMSDALNALLTAPQHAVKAILTTRIAPRDLALVEPGRQHPLDLDDGLASPYAENVLREMDADGRVGLKTAPDALLNKAREKTRGYPRALEALYAILSVDRYTTLEELLEIELPKEVVEKLVGEAFNRLDPTAQKVMQALAIYDRPVSTAAIDYLLQPHLPSIDSALALNRLVNMHFARRDAGKYYLHSADSEYALSTIPEGDVDDKLRTSKGVELLSYYFKTLNKYPDFFKAAAKPKSKQAKEALKEIAEKENIDLLRDLETSMQELDPTLLQKIREGNNFEDEAFLVELDQSLHVPQAWNQYALTFRAADFFAQARKPRAEWKKLDDLAAQLAEFDLRCEAGDYDTAASVLTDIDYDYLLLWGNYRLMIEMYERIQAKIADPELRMFSLNSIGLGYKSISQIQKAIQCYQDAKDIAIQLKDRSNESSHLGNLGNAYAALGDMPKAIEYYQQALVINREIGLNKEEGINLGNLGSAYATLGEIKKAIDFIEQAIAIHREIGDSLGEEFDLSKLGNRFLELGDMRKAIEFYERARAIERKIGDREGQATDTENIGHALLSLEEYKESEINFIQAIQISDEISYPQTQNYARLGLAQAYLFQNDLINARATIEAALQYDEPTNNHNITALQGIIALRQGERATAQEAFTKSIAQAGEILAKTPEFYSALDAKGLALCGLAICDDKKYIPDAIETFRAARKIAPHAGVVKSALRLFDELVKCDTEGILKDVRNAAEGK